MKRLLIVAGLLALLTPARTRQEDLLDCLHQVDSLACAKRTTDAALDEMELEVTGRRSPISFSRVIEESGSLVVDGVQAIFGAEDESTADTLDDSGIRESRKKKFGKKKKKLLDKLITLAMLFKSKISLILQVISTHFQLKFFAIAVISLLINAGRFWLDLKKIHHPAKVIYYEHAQHQHHYDHEDEAGYWGRSADNGDPQELAYSAWAPDR